MKFKTIIFICISIFLIACHSLDDKKSAYMNPTKKFLNNKHLITQKEVNYILFDGAIKKNILGQLSLYKLKNECQIDNALINSEAITTYHYIFKNNKLTSSHSSAPNQWNRNITDVIWNDPNDENIVANFNKAKEMFSLEELHQCQ